MDCTDQAQDRDRWQVAGACECGNEPSGSIECGEFLNTLRTGDTDLHFYITTVQDG